MFHYFIYVFFACFFLTTSFILIALSDVVKHHGNVALAFVIAIETMVWVISLLSSVMISIVNQSSYNEKSTNNQLINANINENKGWARDFYDNIIVKYVSKLVVEAVTIIISTIFIIFLSHSGIYMVKDVKKSYKSSYDVYIFWAFICLGFYSAVMILLCESGFGFVIIMGICIELSVNIGHEINDQYDYPFYLAISVGLCLFIARATIHYWYNERLEIKEREPAVRQRGLNA